MQATAAAVKVAVWRKGSGGRQWAVVGREEVAVAAAEVEVLVRD